MPSERYEIIITSKGSRTVKRDFDSVAKSADRTGKAAERTGKTIDTSMRRGGAAAARAGAAYRRTARDVDRVGQSGVVAAGRMRAFTRSLVVPSATNASLLTARRNVRGLVGAFSAFYAVRFIGETADSFTRMNNALKGFGVGANSVDRIRKAVTALSNDARVDAEQAVVLFGRLRLATRDLGLTTKDVLGLTGTINKALRLSGSSAIEASQSIRQLSQAFNKGKLDGDEFRSVLENAPILTKLLSAELKISKRELRDWAEQGKISVTVLANALAAGQKEIDEAFGKLTPTLGDSFKVLNNKIREFIGTTPAFTNSMRIASKLILTVADNLSVVLGLLEAIAAVKIGRSILNLASDLGGARALGAIAAGLSAAPAAAVGAAGIAGGAGASGTRIIQANAASLGAGALGGAIAPRGGATQIRKLEKSLPVVAQEAKKLNVIVGTGLTNSLKSVGRFLLRVGSRFKAILKPANVLLAIVAAVALGIGGGMVKGLEDSSTSTTAWAEATKLLGLYWQTFGRYVSALLRTLGTEVDSLLQKIDEIFTLLMVSAKAMSITVKKLMVDILLDLRDGLRVVNGIMAALNAQGIATPSGPLLSAILGEVEAYTAAGGLRGKTFNQAFQDEVQSEFELLGSDSGGMLARFKAFTSDIGVMFLDGLKANVIEQELRNAYQNSFEEVEQQAGRIKDLFRSDDGVGSFLKPAEIDAEVQKLERLIALYDDAQLKPDKFDDKDTANIKNAVSTLGEVRNFLKDSAEALEAFDAAVRSGTGSEGEVKSAIAALEKEIQTAADKLPPELRDAAVAGANEMITQARAILVAGALDIGAAVKSALLQGFGGTVGGLLDAALKTSTQPDINGNNLPPGLTPGGAADAIGDGGAEPIRIATDKARLYNDELQTINRNLQGVDASAGNAFKKAGDSAKNAANDIQQFFESAFGSLEDALVGFVTTGKLDFKSLINSIIADLARMVIRMLIIKPLMGFFGGLFGFAGGGVVPGFANGGVVKGFATGGVISGFGGAKSDNQLIAASPGEMIINKRATDDNIGALQYINKTGMMPPSPNKQGGIVYAPVINVQSDSGGDGQATAQMIDAAIRRSWDELAIKAQRKGGVFG